MAGDWEPRPYWVYIENGKEYARMWWEPGRFGLNAFGYTYWCEASKQKPAMRPLDVTQWAAQCIHDAHNKYMVHLAAQRAARAARRG